MDICVLRRAKGGFENKKLESLEAKVSHVHFLGQCK
jgi:hypothetical protein